MPALKQAALRLAKRRRLASPRRGVYIIVPLDHRDEGAPPIDSWLGEMLRYQGAREIERAWEGGEIVVTVDRFQRGVKIGGNPFRFRVRRT